MLSTGEIIDPQTLDRPVTGPGLEPGPLRAQLGGEETLLVFLRHLG